MRAGRVPLGAAAVAVLLLVAGLSGCVAVDPLERSSTNSSSGENPSTSPTAREGAVVRIPDGAAEPASTGPSIVPGNLTAPVDASITIVNDDQAEHRLLGVLSPVDHRPFWAASSGDGHGHDHDHGDGGHGDDGGGTDDPAFDVTVGPGKRTEVTLPTAGRYEIHCHPHPWMKANWTAAPEGVDAYPVVVNRYERTGSTVESLDTSHAPESIVSWNASAPNLEHVNVTAAWDDSEDDSPAGESANHPDTVQVQLKDPSGTVVAEDTRTARKGEITLAVRPDDRSWPEVVDDQNRSDAYANLQDQHPPSAAGSGWWKVHVILKQAPGPVPGVNGSHDVPGTDGMQDVSVHVETVHIWGDVVWPGDPVEPEHTSAVIDLDGDGHDHDH